MTGIPMNYLLKALFVLSLVAWPLHVTIAEDSGPTIRELNLWVESKEQEIEVLGASLRKSKIALRKEESHRPIIRLNLRKLELNVKRLKFSAEKDTDEIKNQIIGLNYDIKSHKKKLTELQAQIDQSRKKQAEGEAKLGGLKGELEELKGQQSVAANWEALRQADIEQAEKKKDLELSEQSTVDAFEAQNQMAIDAAIIEEQRIQDAKRRALVNPYGDDEPQAEEGSEEDQGLDLTFDIPDEPEAFDLELEQAKLINEARNMRPAAAALNHAKARALVPMDNAPLFGEQVELSTSLPPGKKPKSLGMMRHLGNNQYMLQIPVLKGKQNFVVGKYKFFKMIPKQFHKTLCMILIDFQNENQPSFQLLFVD